MQVLLLQSDRRLGHSAPLFRNWLPVGFQLLNGSERLVPELSLEICATGLDGVQVSFSPQVVEPHQSAENGASFLL